MTALPTAAPERPGRWLARPGMRGVIHLLGSAWFLGLFLLVFSGVLRHAPPAANLHPLQVWGNYLSRICLAGFYLILWVLLLIRLPAITGSRAPLPIVFAFIGTYLPWIIPLINGRPSPAPVQFLSVLLLLAGGGLIIATVLYLGKSFSLVPQARRLVTTGPYRLIRHPLYVAEEVSVLGAALHAASPWTALLLLVHCAVQYRRMRYEEAILADVFPAYAAYARRTARVLPGIW